MILFVPATYGLVLYDPAITFLPFVLDTESGLLVPNTALFEPVDGTLPYTELLDIDGLDDDTDLDPNEDEELLAPLLLKEPPLAPPLNPPPRAAARPNDG